MQFHDDECVNLFSVNKVMPIDCGSPESTVIRNVWSMISLCTVSSDSNVNWSVICPITGTVVDAPFSLFISDFRILCVHPSLCI